MLVFCVCFFIIIYQWTLWKNHWTVNSIPTNPGQLGRFTVNEIYLSIFLRLPELNFRFWMWRLTVARSVLSLLSAEYYKVMCGAWPGTLVTWPWLRLSMIYCCAVRLWSQICVGCQSCWFPDLFALSCFGVAGCLRPEGWLHTYEVDKEHFADPNLSVVVAICWFLMPM